MVKHYLERSGALGLTIRLKSFDLEPTTLALFDLICTHIHRWKHVQFEVDGHFFNSRPFMSFTGDVQAYPMLQSVGMLSADTRSDRHGASALIDLAHLLDLSPNCTLVRWGGPTEVMLNYDLFPWNRLQDIELHNLLTIPQLYKLLNLCGKNLRTITSKHVVAQGLRLNAFPQDINLGLLTGLSFHGSVLGQLKVVTDHLTIPKLKHLHISTDAWSNFSDFGIPNLITRSECSLKSLRLRSVYMPPEDLEIILRASPDLSLLSITSDEPVIDDRLMDLMIPQPSNPSHDHLVPHLRTLQLVNTCLDIDIEDGKLASLLSSREQVNPFKYLQIKLPARVAAMHQKDRVEFNRYRFASSRHISFESMVSFRYYMKSRTARLMAHLSRKKGRRGDRGEEYRNKLSRPTRIIVLHFIAEGVPSPRKCVTYVTLA